MGTGRRTGQVGNCGGANPTVRNSKFYENEQNGIWVINNGKGKPIETNMHDFPDKELGKAVPYGVYDIGRNEGWVNVGIRACAQITYRKFISLWCSSTLHESHEVSV